MTTTKDLQFVLALVVRQLARRRVAHVGHHHHTGLDACAGRRERRLLLLVRHAHALGDRALQIIIVVVSSCFRGANRGRQGGRHRGPAADTLPACTAARSAAVSDDFLLLTV
jgi:hypothetical protein